MFGIKELKNKVLKLELENKKLKSRVSEDLNSIKEICQNLAELNQEVAEIKKRKKPGRKPKPKKKDG